MWEFFPRRGGRAVYSLRFKTFPTWGEVFDGRSARTLRLLSPSFCCGSYDIVAASCPYPKTVLGCLCAVLYGLPLRLASCAPAAGTLRTKDGLPDIPCSVSATLCHIPVVLRCHAVRCAVVCVLGSSCRLISKWCIQGVCKGVLVCGALHSPPPLGPAVPPLFPTPKAGQHGRLLGQPLLKIRNEFQPLNVPALVFLSLAHVIISFLYIAKPPRMGGGFLWIS